MAFLSRLRPFGRATPSLRSASPLGSDAVRLSRQLQLAKRRVVAFAPAHGDAPTTAVCAQIARTLGAFSARVLLIDLAGTLRAQAEASRAAEVGLEAEDLVVARWIEPTWLYLAPHSRAVAGTRFQQVEVLLQAIDHLPFPPFELVILDLAGFDRMGELLRTIDFVDGVIVVAEASGTWEKQLKTMAEAVPAKQMLGFLLVT